MSSTHLLNPSEAAAGRVKQKKEANDMEKAVRDRATRMNVSIPPYDFLELIGKGAYGRVFKSRSQKDGSLVAVKIIDVDRSDYDANAVEKDQAIKDFVTETTILQQLRDSKAKNINIIIEAFDWHSQLWIVSEYCPGGSLHTLMKAGPQEGLEEMYIIPVARELAIALKHIHDNGIIHRDVKAANILISQDGHLQLCDFGVSGVLKSNADKRSTIIGTPYWMAPEMLKEDTGFTGYGTEVDIWAYGIAMIELATGLPPNATIAAAKLHMFMDKPPRLEGANHSSLLKEYVEHCLKTQPQERPTPEQLLQHSYIANTSKRYPTTILKGLIDRFHRWELMGGQRMSLYDPHGAAPVESLDGTTASNDGWIFSTQDDFGYLGHSVSTPNMRDEFFGEDYDRTPKQSSSTKPLTPFEKAKEEQRVLRGERALARLFDQNTSPYDYSESEEDRGYSSDLPFRNMTSDYAANRNTLIDLDAASDVIDIPVIDLADVPTIRAQKNRFFMDDDDEEEEEREHVMLHQNTVRRATRDWKFPMTEKPRPLTMEWSMAQALSDVEESQRDESSLPGPFRPKLKHTATEPIGKSNDFLHPITSVAQTAEALNRVSVIDIDVASTSRPSTANSSMNSSVSSLWTDSDPFNLEIAEPAPFNRASLHMHSQSEPPLRPSSQRSFRRSASEQHRRSSLSSDEAELTDSRPISGRESIDTFEGQSLGANRWSDSTGSIRQSQAGAFRQSRAPLFSAPPGASFTGLDWSSFEDDSYSAPAVSLDRFRVGQHWPADRDSRSLAHQIRNTAGTVSGSSAQPYLSNEGRRVVFLPEPRPPQMEALVPEPSNHTVTTELSRLMIDFLESVKAASSLVVATLAQSKDTQVLQ